MKKAVFLFIAVALFITITGCTSNTQTIGSDTSRSSTNYTPDYIDAATFENALNSGEHVSGKIVQFDVIEYKPQSALGINCWSGKHLNFISEFELDVKKGDIIIGRILYEPTKSFGSWKILYEPLEIGGVKLADQLETNTDGEVTTAEEEDNGANDSIEYVVGDEIILGGVKFNVYKIGKDKSLFLLAQQNIASTPFSDSARSYDEAHNYEGSLVEAFVNKFVHDLEDKGYSIRTSGIIDKDDLLELGFVDSITISGRPYLANNVPDFVSLEDNFWLGGYYKVETYQWTYFSGKIDVMQCEDVYGVRPAIVIDPCEATKVPSAMQENLTIEEIVTTNSTWVSEGGIHNPYDLFYFDCENMKFTNIFESPKMYETYEYGMEFIDERTIQIEGFGRWYPIPARLIIVNENKLRIRFLDDSYNDGDYFLIRAD